MPKYAVEEQVRSPFPLAVQMSQGAKVKTLNLFFFLRKKLSSEVCLGAESKAGCLGSTA